MSEKLSTFDRAACREVGAATEAALREVAERFGLTIEVAGGKYDPATGTFSPKVTYSVDGAGQREWDLYCTMFGLTSEHYGATFTSNGRTFTVTGVKPRAPKRPIICAGDDGKSYVFPAETVVRAVAR